MTYSSVWFHNDLDVQFNSFTHPSAIQGYVTGANDGKLIFYDLNGNCRELCETPPNVHSFLIHTNDMVLLYLERGKVSFHSSCEKCWKWNHFCSIGWWSHSCMVPILSLPRDSSSELYVGRWFPWRFWTRWECIDNDCVWWWGMWLINEEKDMRLIM